MLGSKADISLLHAAPDIKFGSALTANNNRTKWYDPQSLSTSLALPWVNPTSLASPKAEITEAGPGQIWELWSSVAWLPHRSVSAQKKGGLRGPLWANSYLPAAQIQIGMKAPRLTQEELQGLDLRPASHGLSNRTVVICGTSVISGGAVAGIQRQQTCSSAFLWSDGRLPPHGLPAPPHSGGCVSVNWYKRPWGAATTHWRYPCLISILYTAFSWFGYKPKWRNFEQDLSGQSCPPLNPEQTWWVSQAHQWAVRLLPKLWKQVKLLSRVTGIYEESHVLALLTLLFRLEWPQHTYRVQQLSLAERGVALGVPVLLSLLNMERCVLKTLWVIYIHYLI